MAWNEKGDAEVVQFGKLKGDMRFQAIEEVRGYWEALRSGRPVPLRSEVDPRGIEQALENTFVLERIAPGVARFRIAGMHLNDLMGMEVRGMPVTAFFTPRCRDAVAKALEDVFSGPQIAELVLTGERGIGKPVLEGRIVLLPLKSDDGQINRALGCLVTAGPVGRAPRRFDIADQRVTPILPAGDFTVAPYPSGDHPAQRPQAPGFAESIERFDQAPRVPRPTTKDGRPQLRLVKSDK